MLGMEASCVFCGGISTLALKSLKSPSFVHWRRNQSILLTARSSSSSSSFGSLYLFDKNKGQNRLFCYSLPRSSVICSGGASSGAAITKRRNRRRKSRVVEGASVDKKSLRLSTQTPTTDSSSQDKGKVRLEKERKQPESILVTNVLALYQNGDPLGRRDLGKLVVKWICQGMKVMASDFAAAEMQDEFAELSQRMGPGLTFVIQAQPYLNAVPMPLGLEAVCLKVCTHYPTLFDNFQRELREVLMDLQQKGLIQNWRETQSWKLLKELANSGC